MTLKNAVYFLALLSSVILTSIILWGCLDCSMPVEITDFISQKPGGRLRYLTNWCNYYTLLALAFGNIVFLLSSAIDNYQNRALHTLHKLMITLALPLQEMLTLVYWYLLFSNPANFRRPEFAGKNIIISELANHAQHTIPLITCFLHALFTGLTTSIFNHLFFILFGLFYAALCFEINDKNPGFWPYPFLENGGPQTILIFFTSIPVLTMVFYDLNILVQTIFRLINRPKKMNV